MHHLTLNSFVFKLLVDLRDVYHRRWGTHLEHQNKEFNLLIYFSAHLIS